MRKGCRQGVATPCQLYRGNPVVSPHIKRFEIDVTTPDTAESDFCAVFFKFSNDVLDLPAFQVKSFGKFLWRAGAFVLDHFVDTVQAYHPFM